MLFQISFVKWKLSDKNFWVKLFVIVVCTFVRKTWSNFSIVAKICQESFHLSYTVFGVERNSRNISRRFKNLIFLYQTYRGRGVFYKLNSQKSFTNMRTANTLEQVILQDQRVANKCIPSTYSENVLSATVFDVHLKIRVVCNTLYTLFHSMYNSYTKSSIGTFVQLYVFFLLNILLWSLLGWHSHLGYEISGEVYRLLTSLLLKGFLSYFYSIRICKLYTVCFIILTIWKILFKGSRFSFPIHSLWALRT